MAAPKNVQIPYDKFLQMIKLCEEMRDTILFHSVPFDYYSDLEDVMIMLYSKQAALIRRDAYGKLAAANKTDDEAAQIEARIEYLKLRGPRRPD